MAADSYGKPVTPITGWPDRDGGAFPDKRTNVCGLHPRALNVEASTLRKQVPLMVGHVFFDSALADSVVQVNAATRSYDAHHFENYFDRVPAMVYGILCVDEMKRR